MASPRQPSMPSLPLCVIVRSKKDELYNDFIGLLEEENASFPVSEVNCSGRNFTKMAVDCLWYIDGHHNTLQKQSCPIPQLFHHFVGYNTPKLSKHRKRQVTNMSSAMVSTLASSLFQDLQGSFWSHASLQRLYQQTQSLAQSLAG